MIAYRSMIRSIVSPDGALILDIEQDRMIRLNRSGGQIWISLQAGTGLEEIARQIAAQTGADFDTVRRDVHDFYLQLNSLLPLRRRTE
jgi:Coenzyme PQQ synthesis protein D (PqqD)